MSKKLFIVKFAINLIMNALMCILILLCFKYIKTGMGAVVILVLGSLTSIVVALAYSGIIELLDEVIKKKIKESN